MNILSALIAFLGCALAGVMSAYRLGARARGIEFILSDVKKLRSQMLYTSSSLKRIFNDLDSSPISALWKRMAQELSCGSGVHESWQKAYAQASGSLGVLSALKDDELRALSELFSELGNTDMNTQDGYFSLFFDRLDSIYSEALNAYQTRGRVFRGLGTLGGIALAILFI